MVKLHFSPELILTIYYSSTDFSLFTLNTSSNQPARNLAASIALCGSVPWFFASCLETEALKIET